MRRGRDDAATPTDRAADAGPSLPAGEGRLRVDGGRLWYKVAGTDAGTPIILLHGGPGLSSHYLKAYEALGNERRVVRYDQLGGGKSDPLADSTKFTTAHFVAELDALRTQLGFDRVHLLGHAWGAQLAVEYYRAHPEHVASLTLASPSLDMPAWRRNTRRLVATLSDTARRAIRVHEADQDYGAADYQAATMEYFRKYVSRRPAQADADSMEASANGRLHEYMRGPSEFTITGTLRRYDATPLLRRIAVPTLYTVGEVDEADGATVRRFAELTPNARVVVIPDAAHYTTWDAPEQSVRAVRSFLDGVEHPDRPRATTRPRRRPAAAARPKPTTP